MSEKHHSHEIGDHPEIRWALELLSPDGAAEPNIVSKYSAELICVGSGFAIPSLSNVFNSKPFYSGIRKHIGFVIGGYILSQFAKRLVDDYQRERDTRIRDYIIRHPELFPEPERMKYKYVLEEWIPIR